MRKYWFTGILEMVCLVLLVGLPISARAETAGVTVTAVREKDAPEPSPGPSGDGVKEEPDDDTGNNPEDEPENDSGDNPEEEPGNEAGGNPEDKSGDETGGNSDDDPDDAPTDETLDDASSEDPDDNSEENLDDATDVSEDKEDDGESDQNPGSESEEAGEGLRPEENENPYGKLIRLIPVAIALIGAGILGGITGLWAYLWLLFAWYILKTQRRKWHGILTEEENRFIEIRPATGDYRLAQDIIEYSSDTAEALCMLEETGDLTYLPGTCKVSVSYWLDGEYRMEKVRCDENKLYELMDSLGDVGEKRVLIENRAAGIQIRLVYP